MTSACCEAPIHGEVDYDSVDGLYSEPVIVATGTCSQCGEYGPAYKGDA